MNLCKYKDVFGKPKQGVHSYRVYDIAIVDVLLTFVLSLIIWYIYNERTFAKYLQITLLAFLSGIIMHRMFCVKTTIDKILFS
jgi:hypothetical protein